MFVNFSRSWFLRLNINRLRAKATEKRLNHLAIYPFEKSIDDNHIAMMSPNKVESLLFGNFKD